MNNYEELTKLKELMDTGVITEKEFAKEKKKLLEGSQEAGEIVIPEVVSPDSVWNETTIEELRQNISKWHTIAIITIFIGLIWGIIGLVCSGNAKEAFAQGNYAKAKDKNQTTKTMFWVAIGCNLGLMMLLM